MKTSCRTMLVGLIGLWLGGCSVVVFEDRSPDDKLRSQALMYPKNERCILEAVFPKEGNWTVQLFTGPALQEIDHQPILELYLAVRSPIKDLAYPWIHSAFFKAYDMNLQPPNFLLPIKVTQHKPLSITLVRPDDVHILHKAKNEDAIVDGVTSLLSTQSNHQYQLSANFTSLGQWTILLYASRRGHSSWSLVLSHTLTVC